MEDRPVTPAGAPIWVDELNTSSIRALWRLRGAAHSVRYWSIGEARLSPLRLSPLRLARATGLEVHCIDSEIGDLRTHAGVGLRFAIERTLLEWLPAACDRLLPSHRADGAAGDIPAPRVRRYLLKAAVAASRPALTLAFVARATMPPEAFPVLIVGEVAAEWLRGCPAFDGFDVRVAPAFSRGTLFRRVGALGATMRAFLSAVKWNLRGISRSSFSPNGRIAVQWHMGLDDVGRLKDCPWLPGAGIDPGRVAVYADRPDSPLDAAAATRVEASGHSWINCRTFAGGAQARGRWSGLCLTDIRKTWRRALLDAGRASSEDTTLSVWARAWRIALSWQVSCWEGWCRRHSVAVLMTWADTGTMMLAQAIAVERAGGISAAWQWSHYSFDTLDHARDTDVFFAWGQHYLAGFRHEGSRIGRLLYVGHVSLRADDTRAAAWRSQLETAGAKRIACLFDSSFGPQVHYSEQAMRALYEAMLAEVLVDPSFGLILKPKNEIGAFLASLRSFSAVMATGRCLVLEPTAPPRAAGRAADIVVGFGFNSAAIEAATAGRPAVHADLSGDRLNPFHALAPATIAFTEVEALVLAVRQRLATRQGPIGDHTPFLFELNAFGDSDGARRIGSFLRRYLAAVDAGHDRAVALDEAAAGYQREFAAVVRPPGAVTLELSLAC
jgi:hypothetical protein